jgi:vanillate O-demethylase monooxygenase subunit
VFVRNIWYVAGYSTEVQAGQRMARRILNEPIVLFRTVGGKLSALLDRCSHRAYPLSEGLVEGDLLRCAYHGVAFSADGECVDIPGQTRIPPSACVRSYPVVEKDEFIWIWMGDPALADPTRIIDNLEHRDPAWQWKSFYMHVQANWQLLVDNILDLTHVAYIHAKTIGGNPQVHFNAHVDVKFDGERVTLERQMPNSVPPKTYVAAGGFKGNVDRWQTVDYKPTAGHVLRVNAGACEVNTGAYEGRRDNGFVLVNIHGVTPETEQTTHYIWTICTNASVESGVPEVLFDQFYQTIAEDEVALQAQQRRINDLPGMPFVGIASDGAVNRARKLLGALHARESSQMESIRANT